MRKKRVRKAFRCLKQATHFSHPLKEYRNSYILYGRMRADILTHGRNAVSKINKQSADRHSNPVVLRGGNNSHGASRSRQTAESYNHRERLDFASVSTHNVCNAGVPPLTGKSPAPAISAEYAQTINYDLYIPQYVVPVNHEIYISCDFGCMALYIGCRPAL